MSAPVRVTALLTHPTQYFSPWFRSIARDVPELALRVVYASVPDKAQQATGFGGAFAWDDDLLAGYDAHVVRASRAGDDFSSRAFCGLDVPTIGRAIDEGAPEVLLLFGWHSVVQVRALLHARRRRFPLVYRGDSQLRSRDSRLGRLGRRLLLAQFTAHLAVGTRARELLRAHGVSDRRIFASPHAVDNARFATAAAAIDRASARAMLGLRADAYVIAFVGKLEPEKRVIDLVRAVPKVRGAQLLVVGRGAEAARCHAEAARLGSEVVFAGFKNQGELGAVYAAADVLALPSGDERETWGLVVNEALACGVPCVVSDVVGCAPDLVLEGRTGARHAVADVDGLVRALGRVRDARMADACRARAAEHDFAAASAGLLAAATAVARGDLRR